MEQDAPQPDLTLCILPENGGQSRDAGKYAAGVREYVRQGRHLPFESLPGVVA